MSHLARASPLLSRVPWTRLTSIRTHTNRDWKPGLCPKTEAERVRAAAKYGLHPSDYKPLPSDGMIDFGDYPDVAPVTWDMRDPYYDWDDPAERRDYNEPFTEQYFEFYQPRRMTAKQAFTYFGLLKKASWCLGPLAAFMVCVLLTPDLVYMPAYYGVQMPSRAALHGERHYLFEKKEEENE